MTTQTALKSYFEHGDIPSQSQFTELIDTIFELFNNAQATANAAVASATEALAAAKTTTALKQLAINNGSAGTTTWSFNVASVQFISNVGLNIRIRINFTAPYANTDYILIKDLHVIAVVAKNASYIELDLQLSVTHGEIVIFGEPA